MSRKNIKVIKNIYIDKYTLLFFFFLRTLRKHSDNCILFFNFIPEESVKVMRNTSQKTAR